MIWGASSAVRALRQWQMGSRGLRRPSSGASRHLLPVNAGRGVRVPFAPRLRGGGGMRSMKDEGQRYVSHLIRPRRVIVQREAAAVGVDGLAGDVGGVVAGQERGDRGDFLGFAGAAE